MYVRKLILILTLIIPIFWSVSPASGLPEMDGIITPGEWDDSTLTRIELTNGEIVNLKTKSTTTDIYYLATLAHNKPEDTIILDPSGPHDYLGIEFDNNEDGSIMGSSDSPDDTIIVNYDQIGAQDMFMQGVGTPITTDTENGGSNDVEGAVGSSDGKIIWEMKRPLTTGDEKGKDIQLSSGQNYDIMIAFWDDKNSGTATEYTNKAIEGNLFITLVVGPPLDKTLSEIIGFGLLISSLILGVVITKQGISR